MDETRLLPCPFCGESVRTFGPMGWHYRWGISHKCAVFDGHSRDMAHSFVRGFATEADAIAAWNTRSAPVVMDETAREIVEFYGGVIRATGYFPADEMQSEIAAALTAKEPTT